MSGWIKLHRSLLDWEWWDDHNATRLLVFLLCAVNREENKWKGIVIKPGQIALSWETLSMRCGMTTQQCRTAMTKLEQSNEVTRKVTSKYQVVTLVKWEKLQVEKKKVTRKTTDKQQTNNKQITTIQEYKEDIRNKEIFNFKKSLIDLGVEKEIVSDWLIVRKNKKATNSKTAFEAIKKEIEKSDKNANECIKIAVEHSWSGFKNQWIKNLENGKIISSNGTSQKPKPGKDRIATNFDTDL